MDKRKTTGKNNVIHFISLFSFVNSLNNLKTHELKNRLKTLNRNEIYYISEIIHNFLKGVITVDSVTFQALRLMRSDLHYLVKKSISLKNKHRLITSLRGVNILKLILPFASKLLSPT